MNHEQNVSNVSNVGEIAQYQRSMITRGGHEVRRPEYLTVDLRPIKRPISEEIIAWRLVAVIPNQAKWNMMKNSYETSFHKKYQVYTDGDFNKGNKFTVAKFVQFMNRHNIDITKLKGESTEIKLLIDHIKQNLSSLVQ